MQDQPEDLKILLRSLGQTSYAGFEMIGAAATSPAFSPRQVKTIPKMYRSENLDSVHIFLLYNSELSESNSGHSWFDHQVIHRRGVGYVAGGDREADPGAARGGVVGGGKSDSASSMHGKEETGIGRYR